MKVLLREKLKKNKYALGCFCSIPAPSLVENVSMAGLDFVVIDTEHGESNFETVVNMARAAMARGVTPIVRVTSHDVKTIGRYLDNGLHGVQVPMVETKEQAETIVRACRFAPEGDRGLSAGRGSEWGRVPDYTNTANREIMCVCMCETAKGVENIEEIVSVPTLDVVFVGLGDLSQSMGLTGQMNDPRVIAAAEKVRDACLKAGVVPGVVTSGAANAEEWIKRGFKYVTCFNDMALMASTVNNIVSTIHKDCQ